MAARSSHSLPHSFSACNCCVPLCFLLFVFVSVTHSLVLDVLLHLSSLTIFVGDLLTCWFLVCSWVCVAITVISSSDTKITLVSQLLELNHASSHSDLLHEPALCRFLSTDRPFVWMLITNYTYPSVGGFWFVVFLFVFYWLRTHLRSFVFKFFIFLESRFIHDCK